ncbi:MULTISPECIES: ribbon-helix-helix protein, CopG family [Gordonia]|uniref:ribbon-helix-helix protein, CopG family n=1 Tax=Gordonia TaxID=2053 RepID=UPI0007828D05|nr:MULTISPECIES: ribbon-helix-helix protein, CopG family [Gordonia]WFN94157.1 ribbon-helix-helix protein, CopG family [Gordonia sihwensis]WFN94218.1 ribbon-helix-helix protein, CopG family [Gordonia sihwensis]
MNDKDRVERKGSTIENVDLDAEEVRVNGERYTEADAEDDAAWAEGAARRRASNLVPGGKSLSGGKAHSPVLNVRVPASVKDALDAEAKAAGIGTSKLVRRILEAHMKAS